MQFWSSLGELWPRGPHHSGLAPSPTCRVRRAGSSRRFRPLRGCPLRVCPLRESLRTSAETPACGRPHPSGQLLVERSARVIRRSSHPREISGGRSRSGPQPKEGHWLSRGPRAPTHRGASLALPRVPMAAAALQEPPHLARWVGLSWAHSIAAAAAACGAGRPGPLHPRAAHPPLSEPGEPARRAPAGTNFVCARPLAFIRARALTLARTHHLTH